MSPNIYEKQEIRPLINSLRALRQEWANIKGFECEPITYEEGKSGVVVTFLAILELSKQRLLEIVQTETYGVIHIKLLSDSVEANQSDS